MAISTRVLEVQAADEAVQVHVISLDPGAGSRKPFLLDTEQLAALTQAIDGVRGDLTDESVVVVTGTGSVFCAGADLDNAAATSDANSAREFAEAGHRAFQALQALPVTTVALLNGTAIGGGFELALHADHRFAVEGSRARFSLPEARLGLIPGWGGTHMLPQLVGFEAAVDLMVSQATRGATGWSVEQASRVGFIDGVIPASDDEQATLTAIVRELHSLPQRETTTEPTAESDLDAWAEASTVTSDAAPALPVLIDLLQHVVDRDEATNRQAQVDALVELIPGEQLRRARYAMRAVDATRAGKVDDDTWRPTSIGVIGAGLMANQLASVLAASFQVPVIMRDIAPEVVDKGLAQIKSRWDRAVERGRLDSTTHDELIGLVTGTTDLQAIADCDFIIEAVPEVMSIKQQVFGELEEIVSSDAILATNTSALSVTEMARNLAYPERVVGLHFFNPVDRMPLIEVVHTDATSERALSHARDVTTVLRRHSVQCGDRPGFIVNRLLVLMLSRVVAAVERGAPIREADQALAGLGLPMSPFTLLDLVTPAVADHVLRTLHTELGSRFVVSSRLKRAADKQIALVRQNLGGQSVVTDEAVELFSGIQADQSVVAEIADDVLRHLAAEVTMMLDEAVADSREAIDAAMILGAGWPFHLGGLTPYLVDRGYLDRQ